LTNVNDYDNIISTELTFVKFHKVENGGKHMAQVTKETKIGELLQLDKDVSPILFSIGMHCLGCPASQGETIEEAAMVHGVNADELVNAINQKLAE
jgi:hybrid cluster-associated redox disulfide protein